LYGLYADKPLKLVPMHADDADKTRILADKKYICENHSNLRAIKDNEKPFAILNSWK
jgi:hypothetical protein